ncbi:MAG: hypothetical protein GY768_02535 [Planctomycetaceae bacterium]|nr:hypothetical protein [Planctomycetaceae bacterium]
MRFMLCHPARCAVVLVVSTVMFSVGCQTTRNGLARVPGMGWVGTGEDESFSGWESESDSAALPTPSSEVTPQVVSSGDQQKPASEQNEAYPSTGYPSPYGDEPSGAASEESYAGGTESLPEGSVGGTQKGFYDENYEASDESISVADQRAVTQPYSSDPYSSDPYGDYATPYGREPSQGGTIAASANPDFEQIGREDAEPIAEPYAMDPVDDLGDANSGLRENYGRLKDGVNSRIRNGATAITDTAGRFQDDMNGYTREKVQDLRDSVESGYDNLSETAKDGYGNAIGAAQNAVGKVYRREGEPQDSGDYLNAPVDYDSPASDSANSYDAPRGYSDLPTDTRGGYSEAVQDSVAPGDQPAATSEPDYSQPATRATRPRRTPRAWRPGSTQGYGRSESEPAGLNPTPTASGYPAPASQYAAPQTGVAPASYPPQERNVVPSGRSDYPNGGWESEADSRRLSPSYR